LLENRSLWSKGKGEDVEPKGLPNLNPVVALNSALGFINPLPIEERPLNQCHLLHQSIGDL